MEYVITANRPFEEIEALTTHALEQQGLVVHRTFSLRSAVGAAGGITNSVKGTGSSPGYSVLMLYASGTQRRPLGFLTLYERGRRIVINPVLTPMDNGRPALPVGEGEAVSADADAEVVAALVLSELEFCVEVAKGEACIDPVASGEERAASGRRFQDPVCGKWIDLRQAEAGIEHEGIIYHVCCSWCQEEFEREPGRYARVE
jgi:YHS domain-containing protein